MNESPPLVAGLERIGLVALRAPWRTLFVLALLLVVAGIGIARLEVNDGLDDFLKSDSDIYRTYEAMRSAFRTSETDVLMIARPGPELDATALGRLRDIHLDLGLAPGVSDVYSMFSVHEAVDGTVRPVIPGVLPEGAAAADLAARLADYPGIGGSFLAADAGGAPLVLYVVGLDPDTLAQQEAESVVAALSGERRVLESTYGVSLAMTGAPVIRAEILQASHRDSIVFNVAGFSVGLAICLLFFRNVRLVAVVILPPVTSVAYSLGLIGLAGVPLNPLVIAVIPLVLVVTFANALHLVFAVRRGLRGGRDVQAAARDAVLTVGPACTLSALTTAIALASLIIADTPLISEFGLVAAGATGLSLLTVVTMVPALAAVLLNTASRAARAPIADALDRWFAWQSPRIVRAHAAISIAGIAAIVGCSLLYVQLEPRYRLLQVIPVDGEARETAVTLDERFGGVNSISVLVRSEGPFAADWPHARAAIADASRILEEQAGLDGPRSILALLPKDEEAATDRTADLLGQLPGGLVRRFLSADGTTALVSASAPDMEAIELERLRVGLVDRLATLGDTHPGIDFAVTGLAPLSAERAVHTISNLNRALLVAMVIVFVTIGVLFRSFELALLGVFANLFAVLGAAAWLYVTGAGLQYVSVVGLTVAFGLAVDDTVHFLNRYRYSRSAGMGTRAAVSLTVERIGAILVLTTVVVVCGMASMLLSDVALTRLFGTICIVTLFAALVGDVVFLPALAVSLRHTRAGRGGIRTKEKLHE